MTDILCFIFFVEFTHLVRRFRRFERIAGFFCCNRNKKSGHYSAFSMFIKILLIKKK